MIEKLCVGRQYWGAVGAVEGVARIVKISTHGRVGVCDSEAEVISVGSKDCPSGGRCGSNCGHLVKSSRLRIWV